MRRDADLEAVLTQPISFKRHRFPPDIIRYAVWLYFRFTLSIRDVDRNGGAHLARTLDNLRLVRGPQTLIARPCADRFARLGGRY